MTSHPLVIVGAGLAGATAAFEMRRLGVTEPITLVGEEPHLPYERPELTKGYLRGDLSHERLMVRPEQDYADHDISVMRDARAVHLDARAQAVHLVDGRVLPYGRCILATGLRATLPPVPGIEEVGALAVRTAADADALRARLTPGARVLCLGLGFIGAEVAASALALGAASVVGVDPLPGPMWTALGPVLSARMAELHARAGVDLRLGVAVTGLARTDDGIAVTCDDARTLMVDVVIAGTGARPDTDWLAASGITLDRGFVVVDEHGRTSLPHVHAAGDVTLVRHADGSVRHHEHWQSALDQGVAVARDIAGIASAQEHLPVPWFWSVQHGRHLQVAGEVHGDLPLVLRHDDADGWLALEHDDGTITAVVALDLRREFSRARKAVGRHVDPALIADPTADLPR